MTAVFEVDILLQNLDASDISCHTRLLCRMAIAPWDLLKTCCLKDKPREEEGRGDLLTDLWNSGVIFH